MNEEAQPKKAFYRESAFGVAVVLALVLIVRAVMPDFPSTSSASMVFFAAFALATFASLGAAIARSFVKIPARVPVSRWVFTLVVSRISFAWAMFLLLAVAVIGSFVDRQLSRALFHALVVEIMLAAFWFMATSAVAIAAPFWSRAR